MGKTSTEGFHAADKVGNTETCHVGAMGYGYPPFLPWRDSKHLNRNRGRVRTRRYNMRAKVLLLALTVVCGVLLNAQQNDESKPAIEHETTQGAAQPKNKLPEAPRPQKPPDRESKISASGKLPAILAPQMTRERLDPGDKFRLYLHQAVSPVGFLATAFGAGLTMASPPDRYPREWKDGAGAYGRLYGDAVARRQSELAVIFLSELAFREDPRYLPSASHNMLIRIAHAAAFVIVDRSDSGHERLALSNVLGAAASGFIGTAYLPGGYNDFTHAGQRTANTLSGFVISNVANEFCPEWGPIVNRMHLPLVHPPCAERMRDRHRGGKDQ
jgi:hypothetical protein